MTDQVTQDTPDTDAQPSPAGGTVTAQLQLQDILTAAQVIQLASSRGAFRADEFTQIGSVYDRLVTFLQASGAIKPKDQGEEPKPADETPAE